MNIRTVAWSGVVNPLAACVLAILAITGPLSGAHAQQQANQFKLVEPGYLTVAVFVNGRPVITYDAQDNLGGVDGALLASFAASHGLKVKLYKTTFSSTILAVKQGKADVGTWFYYTPERAKQVYYTAPFVKETASAFTLKTFKYDSPESLKGKRAGGVVGYAFAPYIQKAFGSAAQLYPDGNAGGTALLNGQIDAYFDSSFDIFAAPFDGRSDIVAHPLKVGDFGMPEAVANALDYNFVKCDNRELAHAFNAELKTLRENGKWHAMLRENSLTKDDDAPAQTPEQLCSE